MGKLMIPMTRAELRKAVREVQKRAKRIVRSNSLLDGNEYLTK